MSAVIECLASTYHVRFENVIKKLCVVFFSAKILIRLDFAKKFAYISLAEVAFFDVRYFKQLSLLGPSLPIMSYMLSRRDEHSCWDSDTVRIAPYMDVLIIY